MSFTYTPLAIYMATVIFTKGILSTDYYTNASNPSPIGCSNATINDSCTFYCDIATWSGNFDCGNAGLCIIDCVAVKDRCAEGSSFSASNSDNGLNVFASGSGSECYSGASFKLPNYGNANFSIIGTSSNNPFIEINITSGTNTQNIFVDCVDKDNDSCKNINIDARSAQYLEIYFGNYDQSGGNIYCPINSNNQPSCVIDIAQGKKIKGNAIIYAENGFPMDLWWKNGTPVFEGGGEISCFGGITTTDSSSFSDCWNTNSPTFEPTIEPTIEPTTYPTKNPTVSTTLDPITTKTSLDPITTGTTTIPTTTSRLSTLDPTTPITSETSLYPSIDTTTSITTLSSAITTTTSETTTSIPTTSITSETSLYPLSTTSITTLPNTIDPAITPSLYSTIISQIVIIDNGTQSGVGDILSVPLYLLIIICVLTFSFSCLLIFISAFYMKRRAKKQRTKVIMNKKRLRSTSDFEMKIQSKEILPVVVLSPVSNVCEIDIQSIPNHVPADISEEITEGPAVCDDLTNSSDIDLEEFEQVDNGDYIIDDGMETKGDNKNYKNNKNNKHEGNGVDITIVNDPDVMEQNQKRRQTNVDNVGELIVDPDDIVHDHDGNFQINVNTLK